MDALQLDLFPLKQPESQSGPRTVIAVETNLMRFGNRVDVIVVDGRTVRGASLLECDDSDVEYYNMHSSLRE